MTTSTTWAPEGFAAYPDRFPRTPSLSTLPTTATASFIAAWHRLADPLERRAALSSRRARGPFTIVLVRGYMGNYMPGNFLPALRALRAAGLDAFLARTAAGDCIAPNAARLAHAIARRVPPHHRLVFAGHSKGGLEALTVLANHPELARKTDLVLLSQTPHGPSHVLESVLTGRHHATLGPRRALAEATQRLGLHLLGAARGGRELTRDHLPAILTRLDAFAASAPFPIVQTASWSSRPTTWLDSFHERLGEISPGVAHDGQFYLTDLLWPAPVAHVLLPHLDHAQPVMDGFGFDSARYWATLLATFAGREPT
jgi:hypothetical protein